MHRDAGVGWQPSMPALPGHEVLARHLIVRVARSVGGDIDYRERHHQGLGGDLLGRDAAFREMDRRIEMSAGMLDDAPPVEIEAVLLDVERLLELDPRDAEESRKVR